MERIFFFVTLFQELDCCVLLRDQEDMEAEKAREDEGQQWSQDVRSHYKVWNLIIERFRVGNCAGHNRITCTHNEPTSECTMENHAHEELVVEEADTVCYPRTMVVHFEDAPITLGTVVTPVRLCFVAPLTNAHTSKTTSFYCLQADCWCAPFLWWPVILAVMLTLLLIWVCQVELVSCCCHWRAYKGSCISGQILVIFVDHIGWVSLVTLNNTVS